jgi:hypothetical protein
VLELFLDNTVYYERCLQRSSSSAILLFIRSYFMLSLDTNLSELPSSLGRSVDIIMIATVSSRA